MVGVGEIVGEFKIEREKELRRNYGEEPSRCREIKGARYTSNPRAAVLKKKDRPDSEPHFYKTEVKNWCH